MTQKKKREERQEEVILLAGGTGGHVIPAQILAEAFEKRGVKTLFITDQRGKAYLKKEAPFKVHVLNMASGSFLKRLWGVLKNVGSLLKLFRKITPTVVIGFGGYPSASGGLAAILLRISLCLHEQNAVLGRVNRSLIFFSKILFLTFRRTQKLPKSLGGRWGAKKQIVGPLVRPEIEKIGKEHSYPSQRRGEGQKFQVLILGGSQGSLSLTERVLRGLIYVRPEIRSQLEITFQVPESRIKSAREDLNQLGIFHEVSSFFSDMAEHLEKTDLIIARAGSSTVGESLATGRPAIFIPLPSAMDDHQTANASFIVSGKGGWILPQNKMFEENFSHLLEYLFENPEELKNASQNLLKLYEREALEKILESVDVLLKERHKETDFLK